MNSNIDAAEALDAHRWENRLLLIFTPRADDVRARTLNERLRERGCEITERDLVIGQFPMFGDARMGERAIAPESAAQIRDKFNIEFSDFTVILVGKDGYEKRREAGVPDLDSIFGQIDGMPMRQAEMRAHRPGCGG